jgi:hypothetical protein
MKTWERWSFGLLMLLVGVSGVFYFWMKYLATNPDPLAVVNHPWQPLMLHLHVLTSPALILLFGIILNSHILRKLGGRGSANRRTGLISLGGFVVMAMSGYLLQVVTSELMLKVVLVAHLTSAIAFSGSYVAHLVISLRIARTRSWSLSREVA